jgi:hypothetical protein
MRLIEVEREIRDLLAKLHVDPRFRCVSMNAYGFAAIWNQIKVIVSIDLPPDGRRWIHLSCSHEDRLPNWEELKEVKERFIGEEKTALQVLPPKSRYVNFHPHRLHLWHCLDGDVVPDFTNNGIL